MTIELVNHFFSYSTPAGKRLVSLFRKEIFEEVAKSDLYGLIFTYVWAFDLQADWEYVDNVCATFESQGGTVYLVELEADIQTRLERNKTPHRLDHKPTKRDVKWSENELLKTMEKYRLNSLDDEIQRENYMKIDNSDLSAADVAQNIKDRFAL